MQPGERRSSLSGRKNRDYDRDLERLREIRERERRRQERGREREQEWEAEIEPNRRIPPVRERRKKRKKRIILFELLLLALIIAGAFFAYRFFVVSERGYYTVAVFGVDSRDGNVGKGALADVNMIAHINRETGEIRLVSVFRDMYSQIDEEGEFNKINAAYSKGGPEKAKDALARNLDITIDDYATFNWKAIADSINILGGIDLEISESEFRYINSFITETVESTGVGSHHLKSPGMNHLDGVQAVAYARLRLMDTDYHRTQRQRKVVSLAFEKAKAADISTLNNILVNVLPQVKTSISLDDLIPFARNIKKYHLGETAGFPFDKTTQHNMKRDYVIPVTLKSNVIALHQFLFGIENYRPSQALEDLDLRIRQNTGIGGDGQTEIKTDDKGAGAVGGGSGKNDAASEVSNPPTHEETSPQTSSETEADESRESETETISDTTRAEDQSSPEDSDGHDDTTPGSLSPGTGPSGTKQSGSPAIPAESIIEDDEPDTTEAGPGHYGETESRGVIDPRTRESTSEIGPGVSLPGGP